MTAHFALFYYSEELGGAELLIARVADNLAARGYSVTVLDSEKQIIFSNLHDSRVKKITVELDSPVEVECDYLICFASNILNLARFVKPSSDSKVVFWSVHPLNSIYLFPGLGAKLYTLSPNLLKIFNRLFFRKEDVARTQIVNQLMNLESFVAMDGENSDCISSYYGLNTRIPLVPVPVIVPTLEELMISSTFAGYVSKADARRSNESEVSQVFTLAWYGRLADFKAYPLLYLISELGKSAPDTPLELLIIGDGPMRSEIQISCQHLGVNAKFLGSLPNEEARIILQNQADIVFAMGTSALEAAALYIPTVLVDASYKKINFPYGFAWLYETKSFTLGKFVNKHSGAYGHSLESILEAAKSNYSSISEASYSYVSKNHDIVRCIDSLEQATVHSQLSFKTYETISRYKKPLLMRWARKVRGQSK